MDIQISEFIPNYENIELLHKLITTPNPTITEEPLKVFISLVKKHKLEEVITSWTKPLSHGFPSITHFMLNYSNVLKRITDPNDRNLFSRIDIVPFIVSKRPVKLEYPQHIPQYNLFHFGNICHFNACINVLSSLTGLIIELSQLKTQNKLTPEAQLIHQLLLNSLSCVDLNPSLSVKVLTTLNIHPSLIDEADETMKKLLRPLYQSGLSLNTLFFWDSTDEFYKKTELKHTLSEKLHELKPVYFLCRIHDFNSVYDIDDQQIHLESFNITTDDQAVSCAYTLTSLVVFSPGHYVSAFDKCIIEGERFEDSGRRPVMIMNDLNNRYQATMKPIASLFGSGLQHTIGCYVRDDVIYGDEQTADNDAKQ